MRASGSFRGIQLRKISPSAPHARDDSPEALSNAECMTKPQIPSHWHPDTYVVDEFNKVVWKQGNHALALHITHNGQPVPGYTTSLCFREELDGVRQRIKVEAEKRAEEEFEAITEEEWKEFWAEEIERSRAKRERKKQERLQRQTKLATEAGRPAEAGLITEEEWNRVWRKRAQEISLQKGKAAARAAKKEEEEQAAIKSEREARAYWIAKKFKADMRAGYEKLYFPKKKKGFEFNSMHGFAIATVMALIAAFSLDGSKYQDAAHSYLALAGIGAAATYFCYANRDVLDD